MKQRIRIAIESTQAGVQKKKELPFKLLVVGDYRYDRKLPHCFHGIKSLDDALKKIKPTLTLNIKNQNQGACLKKCCIKPRSKKDFSPDRIIMQVPELRALQGPHNLITDLRNRWLHEPELQQHYQTLIAKNGSKHHEKRG